MIIWMWKLAMFPLSDFNNFFAIVHVSMNRIILDFRPNYSWKNCKNCSRVIRVCGNEISIHGHLSNFYQKYHFHPQVRWSLLYSFTVTNRRLIFMSRWSSLRVGSDSESAISPSERWRDISPQRPGSAAWFYLNFPPPPRFVTWLLAAGAALYVFM
jgi:hypothetical protein